MSATFPLMLLIAYLPTPGYIVDCSSYPAGTRVMITLQLELMDGTTFETGRIALGKNSDAQAAQACIYSVIEDADWVVQIGPNDTVIAFGPPGVGVKSIKFDSTGWTPKLKRVFGPPPPKW